MINLNRFFKGYNKSNIKNKKRFIKEFIDKADFLEHSDLDEIVSNWFDYFHEDEND